MTNLLINGVAEKTVTIDGVEIFYREAGKIGAPNLLLLHGFPTSSTMYADLIGKLAQDFHLIAPDYPGYGRSSAPSPAEFDYSFDNLAALIYRFTQQISLDKFALYVQDYGGPVGFRIASAHPDQISGLIIQNANAYDIGIDNDFWRPLKSYWKDKTAENEEALRGFLKVDATKWQYTHGTRKPESISEQFWLNDQKGLDREGNDQIQLNLFYSYGSNPQRYPEWHQYFRTHQPPTLIVWGKNDDIFPPVGAEAYKADLEKIDFNLLDTGHFALNEDGDKVAELIVKFKSQLKS